MENVKSDKEGKLIKLLVVAWVLAATLGGCVINWAWDPKETWAAATWFSYLAYIHFRLGCPAAYRKALFGLLVSFLLLQMCWYGINYLPSAQGVSVHTYNLN